MSPEKAHFQYRPLLEPTEVRVVVLHRGFHNDPIECSLLHKALNEHPYQALSYEWGLPSEDEPTIVINGSPASVRSNLYEALKAIRRPRGDVNIWVDALCINQGDLQERGRQVKIMGEIYRGAKRVIVWVGVASSDSDFVMDMLADRSKLQQLIEGRQLQTSEREALIAFCNRSYWSRVWVLQEIYLAQTYTVRCGNKYIADTDLDEALTTLFYYTREYDYCRAIRDSALHQHRVTKSFRKSGLSHFNTLERWLKVCLSRNLQATQSRDFIYALLGISYDCQHEEIVPDYDKPILDVYFDIVSFLLQSSFFDDLAGRKNKVIFLHEIAMKLELGSKHNMDHIMSEVTEAAGL
jgi:hypothetical protein